MRWTYDDGGRAAAGFRGEAGDCVTRSIAIATGLPYRDVYDALHADMKDYANASRDRSARAIARLRASPRSGVPRKVYEPFLESLGWGWVPTMKIGAGCTVHLRADELPSGRLIVRVSKHITAVVDGLILDTGDPSRGGTRCVYGYFRHLT